MALKALNFFSLLMLASLVAAINPGSYIIANVQFPNQRVAGSGTTTEGIPLLTFRTPPGDEINSNGVWIVNSDQTTLQNQLNGIFVNTDATGTETGGLTNAAVFTVAALDPQPPLLPTGTQTWEFIQGSEGIIIALAGTDFVWSLQTDALFTPVTLVPLNSADLKQQWSFTPQ